MSASFGTIKWGEQEDGTFHLSIPDDEIRWEYKHDYEHEKWSNEGPEYAWVLLEDMQCNSEYVLTSPLSLYLQSLRSMDRIMARGGSARSAQRAE